jgi:hypothetical protein
MGMRRAVIIGSIVAGALALTACVGGPPSPDDVAAEFATPIEPVWEVEVPGLYGEPVIRDGVVLAYADDDEVGMRLTAHALDDGELLWERTSSPGGAYSNPILTSATAASRPYPLPTIAPLVVETGDDDVPAVVYFERDVESVSIAPDDFLRVVDLTTGEPLEVTLPDVDPEEFTFEPLGSHDDDQVFANTYTPAYPCRDGSYCWVTTFAEAENGSGFGVIVLDPVTLEATYDQPFIPESDPESDDSVSSEWGLEYTRISAEGFEVARYADAELLWRAGVDALFDVERTSPPDFVEFSQVGDLVLIQGYQPLLETLDSNLPHTLSIDFVESRTLIAVDAETGEVAWRLPGGDMLCHAVHERPIAADAATIPVCLASDGGFSFDVDTEQMDQTELVASIAEVDVATGEVGWQVDGAGVVSIAHTARLLDLTYAARGDLAVVDDQGAETTQLVDLRDGAVIPLPEEDVFYVCKAERADVELEFEGSAFAGGANPITTGYPAGWYHFPCDDEGTESDVWTKGAVRVAGYPAGDERVILPLEGSLVAFDL